VPLGSRRIAPGRARPVGQSATTFGEDFRLINNRQGGRRRGRGGGGRPPGSNPNPGNRQDNRQRGNAAQLLEKYKGLARDAQMQGDRVLTETYLQYADHYFRVLGESRARYEEQRRQRGDDYGDEDEDQEMEMASDGGADANEQDEPREAEPRRDDRGDRMDRGDRNGEFRGRRPRAPRRDVEEANEERIALDVLPPSISPSNEGDEEPVRTARPRRPRRPREDEDIAPAA
jgi:hypothetical protein